MSVNISNFLTEVSSFVAFTTGTTVSGLQNGNVFKSKLPDRPNIAVAVIPQGGISTRPDDPIRMINTQILVRDELYRNGLTRAQTIFDALDVKVNTLATFKARSEPSAPFGGAYYLDGNNRAIIPLNFSWRLVWIK